MKIDALVLLQLNACVGCMCTEMMTEHRRSIRANRDVY